MLPPREPPMSDVTRLGSCPSIGGGYPGAKFLPFERVSDRGIAQNLAHARLSRKILQALDLRAPKVQLPPFGVTARPLQRSTSHCKKPGGIGMQISAVAKFLGVNNLPGF